MTTYGKQSQWKGKRWLRTALALMIAFSVSSTAAYASEDAGSAAAQSAPELNEETAMQFLDDFFATDAAKSQYVGAAVSIVKDGKVIAEAGYGYADAANETPVDPDETVFRIASVSKTFTAAAVMQLVERGQIDLQEDFAAYLDGITYENPFDVPVTIEHLLTHTTGFEIRDPEASDIHQDFDRFVSIEDYVVQHMPPVVREPGTSYMYDNFGSLLLGLVVQEVSGMPYEDYMDQHLFEPLGMENSGFLLEGGLKDRLAVGYDMAGQPLELYTVTPTVMPHGGMLSTAEDVGKFMAALTNGGVLGDERILSEESVALMEPYRSSIHPLLPDTTYGFEAAWQLPGAGSHPQVITKAGDLNGFSSYLFMIPEQDTGVFLTYNKMGALRNLFYPQFISAFFPEYASPAALDPNFEPWSEEQLEALAGLYSDLRLKVFVSTVSVNGPGSLTISDALLGPRTLTQVDDNLFVDQLANQYTAFKLDEAGQAAYMKEPYLNPLGYAKKGETPNGFADVAEDNPYVPYIDALQSLGHYDNSGEAAFEPDAPVTRADYVRGILEISGVKGSKSETYAFADIEGHPDAAFIQAAAEMGLAAGNGEGAFEPDRAITRQEAAVFIWNSLKLQYPAELFADVRLTGDASEWAAPAVRMMIALGIHGPEVSAADEGTDFLAKQALTKQEEAAIFYQLLTQPTDQIVTGLMQQSQAQ